MQDHKDKPNDAVYVAAQRPQKAIKHRILTGIAAVLLLAAAGDPPSAGVVAERGDLRLTAGDVRGMLDGLDPVTRAQIEANPAALAVFVRQRLVDRALLEEAHAKGFDQKPDVIQRASDARDTAIVQSYVASLVPADPGFPDDAAVSAAYEANKAKFMIPRQYHLAQIAVLVPQGASKDVEDQARRKAADLRTQAMKSRVDFADLARKQSQDKASADRGGDLGWVREDQLIPVVKDAVSGLPDNGVSDVIRVADGWHVLKLIGTKPAGPAPLADIRPQLVQALRQARNQKAVNDYIAAMLRQQPVQLNEIDLMQKVAGQH